MATGNVFLRWVSVFCLFSASGGGRASGALGGESDWRRHTVFPAALATYNGGGIFLFSLGFEEPFFPGLGGWPCCCSCG